MKLTKLLIAFILSFVCKSQAQHSTVYYSQGSYGNSKNEFELKNKSVESCTKSMAAAFQKMNEVTLNLGKKIKEDTRSFYGRFKPSDEKTDLLDLADSVETLNQIQPTYTFFSFKNEIAKEKISRILRYKDFDNLNNARKLCDSAIRKLPGRSGTLFRWDAAIIKKNLLEKINELRFPQFYKSSVPKGLEDYFNSEMQKIRNAVEAI